jgi:hypothetical protein
MTTQDNIKALTAELDALDTELTALLNGQQTDGDKPRLVRLMELVDSATKLTGARGEEKRKAAMLADYEAAYKRVYEGGDRLAAVMTLAIRSMALSQRILTLQAEISTENAQMEEGLSRLSYKLQEAGVGGEAGAIEEKWMGQLNTELRPLIQEGFITERGLANSLPDYITYRR